MTDFRTNHRKQRRHGMLAVAALLLFASAAESSGPARFPDPGDGSVRNGVFEDEYFGLRYPLPPGWTEDLKGPEPSSAGFYSLVALKPERDLSATLQISAQDNFFAAHPVSGAKEFLADIEAHLDPSLAAPHAVSAAEFGGLPFARFDYSGAGLNHSVFATEIRCHTLIFSITAGREEAVEGVVRSLERITFAPGMQAAGEAGHGWPVCIRDYVSDANLVHKVDPAMGGPRYGSVPVRLIIGADGKVEHVHAIAGFPEQIRNVTDALSQWEFKPYIVDGKAEEVETGVLFQFPKAPSQRSANH